MVSLLCGRSTGQTVTQYNPYVNDRSLLQLPQHLFIEATSRGNNQAFAAIPASASYTSYQQYIDQSQFPPTSTQTPTQLWSGPPIVVVDNYNRNTEIGQTLSQRTPKALLPYNHRPDQPPPQEIHGHRPKQQLQPSDFNYGNQVIYHSDVRRHQILTRPDDFSKQQDFTLYPNQQQQQHPLQSVDPAQYHGRQSSKEDEPPQHLHLDQQPQQLYASNTDLNYLRTLAASRTEDNNSFARQHNADYSEHFKEYLRKNPRRIKPVF